ncbi:hypothetical protein LQZ21_00305 [Treponema sp. TIM-1]|uniref:hypothetical protein n=1 Tax=Treponema sp. TIM-1 TaxID=2898417 RepID=UPI00398003A0
MSLFCLLWIPLFYLFWISLSPEDAPRLYDFWALFLGSLTALASFFLGPLIDPGGFGFSRWLSAYIDIVCFPVIFPIIIGFLLSLTPLSPGCGNSAKFVLLWLIPGAVMRTITWGVRKDPLHLVLVPLLWSALAAGIFFFLTFLRNRGKVFVFSLIIGFLLLPAAVAASYWAFFSQKLYLGLLFLIIALIPLGIRVSSFFSSNRRL